MQNYRIAIHEARIRREADEWERNNDYPATKTLADLLGISKRTLWRYEKMMHNLVKTRRYKDKMVPTDYELTPADKERGSHLVWRGQQAILRCPLPSKRRIVGPAQEPRYCRNCGQQPMFPDDPPRVCDYCGAIRPWQAEPPPVAPETLRENGRSVVAGSPGISLPKK